MKKELTKNIVECESTKTKFEKERKVLVDDYEKKIEQTRRETREKVQKVFERKQKQSDAPPQQLSWRS